MKKDPKPKILKVVRTDAFVKIRQEVHRSSEQQTTPDKDNPGKAKTQLVTSTRELEETAHEAPLPAFDDALQALSGVAANILGCPKEWTKGITVVALGLTYTEQGIRSAQVSFVKEMKAIEDGLHPMKTPFFQIDDGKTPAQGRRQCAKGHAEQVIEFIKEAQRYANGERSQQLLKFEEEGDDGDDGKIEKLPGIGDAAD